MSSYTEIVSQLCNFVSCVNYLQLRGQPVALGGAAEQLQAYSSVCYVDLLKYLGVEGAVHDSQSNPMGKT